MNDPKGKERPGQNKQPVKGSSPNPDLPDYGDRPGQMPDIRDTGTKNSQGPARKGTTAGE